MGVELVRERVRVATEALSGLDVSDLDGDEVRSVLGDVTTAGSQLARLRIALTARAGELHDDGRGDDPVDLLTNAGVMPRREARKLVRHAELLVRMPCLAAALKAAEITDGHVDAVAQARGRVDAKLRPAFDACDAEITGHARQLTADRLAERLVYLIGRVERDHVKDLDVRRRRAARLAKWVDADGMHQLRAAFDPETGKRIFTMIDDAIERLRQQPGSLVPGEDPGDPLGSDREFLGAHALARLVSHGHAAEHPGAAEVVLIADERTVCNGEHPDTVCEYSDGTPADPDLVRRLCCEAMFTAVIVTADGKVPLYAGRSIRMANREQRRALRAAHRTCAFQGCDVPFDHCEIHHITWWEHHGGTDITNLIPLCLRHHHLIHHAGWKLKLDPADRTLTVYRPDGSIYSEARPPGLRLPTDDIDEDPPLPAGPPDRSPEPSPTAA